MQRDALAFDGSLKMFASRLAVMPISDHFGMAEPIGGYLERKHVGQFSRSATSQIVRQAGPRNQAGFLDDASQLSSQVLRRCSLLMNDELLTGFGLIEDCFEVWQQFWEQRHDA